ncbi:MAG: hypothetical protein ACLQKA_22730 [Bryobacteraceae bacterium]
MTARRREEWKKVLDSEVERWTAKTVEVLTSELRESQAYQIVVDSKMYNVEVDLVEDTKEYVHVVVSVDDGSLPVSIFPLTRSFIRKRTPLPQ